MRLRWALAFLLCAVGTLAAQTFRGTILGTVSDSTGAVLSGAKVTVRNVGTGLERATQTTSDGGYAVPELPIGTYEVKISQPGFQGWTTRVDVTVASERRVDATLKPGQVSEVVEVSGAEMPQVETTSDILGGTLVASEVKNLPINGRDYIKLIYLNPGITGSPDQASDSPGSYGLFSANGARGRSNNFLLDGTDMNDGYRNLPAINEAGVFGTPATILPIDAVAEVRVLSNYESEYGRNAGSVVNMVTKSGTNAFHGTGLEFFRNNALDARNYFNPKTSPQAPFHNNQFGGSLGGPIRKDKTFFFVNYEGQRERVGVVTLGCVPVGTAADGSLDPSQASNPVIANLLKNHPWPAPNLSDAVAAGNCPNTSVISKSYNRVDSLIGKIDHSITQNDLLTGRYYFGDSDQAFPLALTASGGQLPGFNTYTPTRVQLVSLSYVHTVSPTQVNELRFGWNRFAEGFLPEDRAFRPSSIGLNVGGGLSDSGLPIITLGSFAQLGATSGDPRTRVDSNTQLIDNFSWKKDKHDIKFGFEFRRTTIRQFFGKYLRGKLKFDTLDDFLAGNVDTGFGASFQYTGDSTRHTHENNFAVYAQDSYRITPRVTLNYGMRWDYFGVIGEKNNLFSNITSFDPVGQTFTLTQVGQPGLSSLYEPNYHNFSPRISVAWDVTGRGKTVVRSGFGIFYDAFSQDYFLGHLPYSPFFDPGPAYNPAGARQIIPAAATGSIAPGVPVYGAADCASVECDVFSVTRKLRTPYMENFNVNVEQQLSSKIVGQVGYVGSLGRHLFRFRDISQPSQADITAADLANGVSSYGVPRPYQSNPYGAFYVLQEETTASSNYNSLQSSLRVRDWHGITSAVNYAWSKSLDTASDGEDFVPNAAQPNDSTRPSLEYGPSNFNVPHRFTWIFSYDLPNRSGSMPRLKNGWGFDSTVTLQSGQPFNLNYNFESDFSGGGTGIDRPDVVGPIVYSSNPANYINLSSFAIPCTVNVAVASGSASDCIAGTRHFGNLPRNSLHGPAFKQWDIALHKTTNLTERVSMQFRAEFFNVLNHPNFANPVLPLFIADPGVNGFAINGNREVGVGGYGLSATGDVGIGNPFLGGGGPRGIQLAAKFTF